MPRLLNKIYDKIYDNVRGNLLKEWMLRTALAVKGRAYRDGKVNHNTIFDKLIFDKVRNNLGGRIRLIATGSATLNPIVGESLRTILGCVVWLFLVIFLQHLNLHFCVFYFQVHQWLRPNGYGS